MKTRVIKYWLTKWGDVVETEKNPCGCHPNDYTLTRRSHFDGRLGSFTICFATPRQLTKYMNDFGREELK